MCVMGLVWYTCVCVCVCVCVWCVCLCTCFTSLLFVDDGLPPILHNVDIRQSHDE